jgi:hypothetical protein
MQKFNRLGNILLVLVIIFSLLSCDSSKNQSVEKSKSVGYYLKEAGYFIEISCKLKSKNIALEDLNDCFSWPPENLNDADRFIADCEEKRKSLEEAKKMSDKALKNTKKLIAPEECRSFREECICFFNDFSNNCEKGREISSYFIELGKAERRIFKICDELKNTKPPNNLETVMQKMRNIQKETVFIERDINSLNVPLQCIEYHNNLKIYLDNLYDSANNIISLIKTGDFGRTDADHLLSNFKQKINSTNPIMTKANNNFDAKMAELDGKTLILAEKVNKELENLSIKHFSDSDFTEPGEFFGASYR